MDDSSIQVTYSRTEILEVLRTLDELVVSLDRIGAASMDMTEAQFHAALVGFIKQHNILQKAAKARGVLSEPFDSALGPDNMGELEREMQGVPYWTPPGWK